MKKIKIKELSSETQAKLSKDFNPTCNIDEPNDNPLFTQVWEYGRDKCETTPLEYLAHAGDLPGVKELVDAKATISPLALTLAVKLGRHAVVKYLLEELSKNKLIHLPEFRKAICEAYKLSAKQSCCSRAGFWQRVEEIARQRYLGKTHELLENYLKRHEKKESGHLKALFIHRAQILRDEYLLFHQHGLF